MCPVSLRQEVLASRRALRRVFRCLFAWGCACFALCAVFRQDALAEQGKSVPAPQWIYMPAGARAAYIGIHGGTVPVSLLTSRDGTHMVALVGQTGNDFLRTLKVDPGTAGSLLPVPAQAVFPPDLDGEKNVDLWDLKAQAPVVTGLSPSRLTSNATLLMAGTAVGAMPVIYATGHSFASLSRLYTDSLLFGISENSPLLEGSVKAPIKTVKKAKAAKRQPLVRGSSDQPAR